MLAGELQSSELFSSAKNWANDVCSLGPTYIESILKLAWGFGCKDLPLHSKDGRFFVDISYESLESAVPNVGSFIFAFVIIFLFYFYFF